MPSTFARKLTQNAKERRRKSTAVRYSEIQMIQNVQMGFSTAFNNLNQEELKYRFLILKFHSNLSLLDGIIQFSTHFKLFILPNSDVYLWSSHCKFRYFYNDIRQICFPIHRHRKRLGLAFNVCYNDLFAGDLCE